MESWQKGVSSEMTHRKRGRLSWNRPSGWPVPLRYAHIEQADRDLLDGEVPEWRTWPEHAVERALARIKADIARQMERAAMSLKERKAKAAKDRADLFG